MNDAHAKIIEILGPGCPRCEQTLRVVRHVVEQAGIPAEIRKVDSINRMVELGVLATPAIAVNGVVKLSGQVPKAEVVRQILGIEG
ncbi:MAG: MTH895/ArsE family thioredoxin-like protein [Thermoanaerobaculum sp.]